MRGAPGGTGQLLRLGTGLGALWLALFSGWGCPWFSNMADQPSIRPYEEAPLPAVANTMPVDLPYRPEISYEEANALSNPIPASPASLEAGEALFETYCAVCHGPQGLGDGPVVPKFVRPPDLHGAARGYSDGYIYALITNGRGNMPSYNRLAPVERWHVINYLRELQRGAAAAPSAAPDTAAGAGQPTPPAR